MMRIFQIQVKKILGEFHYIEDLEMIIFNSKIMIVMKKIIGEECKKHKVLLEE